MSEFIFSWSDNLLAVGTGFVVGVVFAAVRLPIPAPRVLPGIVGIFGIWIGYVVVTLAVRKFL